uniref:RCC1 domain-containing protein 1 n=1 Tax=Acrobeloides nanus TaxID=290746 RepID=A0A914BXP2_9BILA
MDQRAYNFDVPERVVQIGCTLEFVFILTETGGIYVFCLKEKKFYSLSPSDCIWTVTNVLISIFQLQSESDFESCMNIMTLTCLSSEIKMFSLVCTMHAAYLLKNDLESKTSSIQRIYDSRHPDKDEIISMNILITKIAAGNDHILLLDEIGSVHAFGSGNHGELGCGSLEFEKKPKTIEFFRENNIKVVDISAGSWHSAAVTNTGDCYTWGWNRNGALGLDSEEINIQLYPFPIETNSDIRVVSVCCHSTLTILKFENGESLKFGCQ